MLPRHARRVNGFPHEVLDYVMWYFSARPRRRGESGWLPSVSLAELGVGQVDVVLALMRAESRPHLECAEWLIGHRIIRCPPCLRPSAPLEIGDVTRIGDMRRVISVTPNPRHPATGAHYRFAIFRPGMSVEQFIVRGGTRRDVRSAVANGWIQLEGSA